MSNKNKSLGSDLYKQQAIESLEMAAKNRLIRNANKKNIKTQFTPGINSISQGYDLFKLGQSLYAERPKTQAYAQGNANNAKNQMTELGDKTST
tara:strand:- start:27 stop:308 length:282 start_codon:yes stop_codon:yes gene_type:complete